MIEELLQQENWENWRPIDLVICMGYSPGEVIPLDRNLHPVQSRILEYLARQDIKKILLCDAYEIRSFLAADIRPSSADVIGAWNNACVYNAARLLLESGIPVRINPTLTLDPFELINNLEETEYKHSWIIEALSKKFIIQQKG